MKNIKDLSDREKLVLYAVVKNFIMTANPVASSFIASHSHLSLSAATIRSVMAELEADGFICQPHTSAGRVPTSAGYRFFVDQMMRKGRLSAEEKEKIRHAVTSTSGDYESIFRESSRILAHLSKQLSIIVSPQLDEGIFHRIDITRLGSDRLLLIISITSGIVKTIIFEIDSDVLEKQLDLLQQLLNERLHGLRLKEIRTKFKEIVNDVSTKENALIHLFIDTADQIFNFSEDNTVFLTGTPNILRQPEFSDYETVSRVVELLEDTSIIIHLLDGAGSSSGLQILIGEEIEEKKMKDCSIIAARYKIGQVQGTVGLVGPTRMDYSHLIPLVEYTAVTLSET
jgi:heat-inducible transcriptional repressor